MADIRESFPVLVDASGAGVSGAAVASGDAAGSKVGNIAFGFRDNTGAVVLPQLDAAGKLPVTLSAAGTTKRARGENAGSGAPVAIATITLVALASYADISIICSCRRDSLFQLIHNNNGVETILLDIVTGPGQFTVAQEFDQLEFAAGATGVQQLIVRGNNFESAATLRATVAVLEKV